MRDQLCDRRVSRALSEVAVGRVSGMGDLVDLLGGSVYRLSRAVTGDDVAAEDATVEAFRQIWQRAPRQVPERAAISWALHVACEVACSRRQESSSPTNGGALSRDGAF